MVTLDPRTVITDTRRVITVRVVVHTTGAAGPNTSDNHWSIYLLIQGDGSIRVNMRADPGYINGILDLSSHSYLMTNSAIQHWDFATVGIVRVCDIVSLIYNYARHDYDMSGGGSGCRYWVYVPCCRLDFKC